LSILVEESREYTRRYEKTMNSFLKSLSRKLLPSSHAECREPEPPDIGAFAEMEKHQEEASDRLCEVEKRLNTMPRKERQGLRQVRERHDAAVEKMEFLREAQSSSVGLTVAKAAKEVNKWWNKTFRAFNKHKNDLLRLMYSYSSEDMEWLSARYSDQVMRCLRLVKQGTHRDVLQIYASLQVLYDHYDAWVSSYNGLEEMIQSKRAGLA